MNLLLLREDELSPSGLATVTDSRRVTHVRHVLRASVGQDLDVGLLGGKMGRGRLRSLEPDRMEFHVHLSFDPPPKLPLTLLLALPRPKVLGRVLESATSLGVERVVLINAWRVEKSYWSSPRLGEERLQSHLQLGLEQGRDTVAPEVELVRLFRPFLEGDGASLFERSRCLLAHPEEPPVSARVRHGWRREWYERGRGAPQRPVVLAIGPEGGWIDEEVSSFVSAGFRPFFLGLRTLRVETAVAVAIGRLS